VAVDKAPLVAAEKSGSIIETVHPVQLSWRDISYTVQEKKKGKGKGGANAVAPVDMEQGAGETPQVALLNGVAVKTDGGKGNSKMHDKRILQSITGHAEPGSFTAILGASGSGKTSLLSVLADRLLYSKGATVTGELLLNGSPAPSDYRNRCAFVQQIEVFYPHSTVAETVEMAARMRLGRKMTKDAKRAVAHEVIQQLGLAKAVDTRVGDGGRIKGISGGEMKRVGIACELVSSPSLLMLDEPTSGLDSNAALNVVRSLKKLGTTGRNVIASIHQPGSAIFAEFDNVVVLAEGRLMYFGPATNCMHHFNQIGYSCPQNFNPADYMLMITSLDYGSTDSENESRLALDKIQIHATDKAPTMNSCSDAGPGPAIENQTSFGEQFSLLYSRIFRDAIRNTSALAIKFAQGIVTTILMVFLYADLRGGKVVPIIQANVSALLFFITITGLFGPLFGTIQAFAPEVSIVIRERMNNLYSVGPYYLAKLAVAIPVELAPLLLQNSLTFWLLGFTHSPARYARFLCFTCGMALASVGIGFVLAVAAGGNAQAASASVGPIALIFLLLGGFYINTSTIPIWISWISKLEYVRFVYEGLAINEFNGGVLVVKDSGTTHDGLCKLNVPEAICSNGTTVLANLFNNGESRTNEEWEAVMWWNFVFILISIFVFWVLGYFVLLSKGPKYLKLAAK